MQSDNEGTTEILEQYRVVLNRTKQASIGHSRSSQQECYQCFGVGAKVRKCKEDVNERTIAADV